MSEPSYAHSEETKTVNRKGQTASISVKPGLEVALSPAKEVATVHSRHSSDILLSEDMSTTGSSKQLTTQTQGRSIKHTSSTEETKQKSVFAGESEQRFEVLMDAMLGEGANGQVFRALDTHTGRFLAVKVIKMNLRSDRWKDKLETLEREIRLLRGLGHPNIVRYLGCGKDLPEAESEGYVKIYMEYMAGGSISRLLKEFGAFEEPVVAKFTKQIVIGLQYLHGMGVMHRDLKGGNILVGPKGTVKLADFGASKQIQGLPIVSNNSEISKSIKGSLYWMAPEMFQKVPYGRKVDIWSLGCVVIEMATGKHPWPNIRMYQELCLAIGQHQIPEIPDHVSQSCKDFISLCLNYDKKLRPHPTALLRHPFLVNALV